MTLSTTSLKSQHIGNNTAGPFTVNEQFLLASDLEVVVSALDGSNPLEKTLGTHYTVTGGNGAIGTISFTSGNYPTTTELVTITRNNMTLTQGADIPANDPLPSDTIERNFGDRIMMHVQGVYEVLSRCLKFAVSSPSSGNEVAPFVASRVLAVNAAGNAVEMGPSVADIANAAAQATAATASAVAAASSAAEAAASAAAAEAAESGLKYRSVRVATTANGTLATAFENGDTVDGIVLATGNRILLKNQTAASQNGIYTVNASGAPTRATDADLWDELKSSVVIVSEGTVNANSVWLCTVNDGGTLGTTDVTYIDYGSTIVNGSLALSKLANIAGNTIIANVSHLSATPVATPVAVNQFLARASTGNLGVKAISDDALAVVAAANVAAMRTALVAATKGQTDFISGEIDTASNRDYTIALTVPYACTITQFSTQSASGTCTAVLKDTAGTVATNSVSTTKVDNTTITNGTVAVGEKIYITISSNASAKNVAFAVHFTRTLA